ncbi:AraC family transcriptional regulator [Paenibacillus sp. sgz302251]|uniref:AraC family transcriptional regulator n=1 Tax=Paenibacillus sp. sgz302251 TaxID=3414493 RepID=UPI003C7D3481
MTIYPYYFTEYPRLRPSLPFIIDIHRVDHSYPAHRHDFLEISLVIEGHGTETINGVSHPMEPGTLSLILPFQFHEIRANAGSPLRLYNCMFSIELLSGSQEYGTSFKDLLLSEDDERPTFFQLSTSKAEVIGRILQEMLEEFNGDQSLRNAYLRTKLIETLIRVDRLRTEYHRPNIGLKEKGDMPGAIWKVIRHIHLQYREQLTLSGLAESFHFNPTYLSEQIKRHAGKSFVGLLHDIRIRHACSLLSSSEMTVSDIAYEVGYGSAKTMFKAFQKYKGVTPGDYRKSLSN